MLSVNHSSFNFIVFDIPIQKLELLLSEWEHFHVVAFGICDCKNVKCLGNYILMRKAYSYRMKHEKHERVTSLFGYDKLSVDKDNLFTVVGMTARLIKKNDTVILRNDFPNIHYKYKVIEMNYTMTQNGLKFFNSKLKFVGFSDNFRNN